MTLADLLSDGPLSYDSARQLALVFSAELAARLSEIQSEGATSIAVPRQLADGRWMLCADLLTEVGPGGLYAEGFSRLDSSRFGDIAVISWNEAVALLPPEPEIVPDA